MNKFMSTIKSIRVLVKSAMQSVKTRKRVDIFMSNYSDDEWTELYRIMYLTSKAEDKTNLAETMEVYYGNYISARILGVARSIRRNDYERIFKALEAFVPA